MKIDSLLDKLQKATDANEKERLGNLLWDNIGQSDIWQIIPTLFALTKNKEFFPIAIKILREITLTPQKNLSASRLSQQVIAIKKELFLKLKTWLQKPPSDEDVIAFIEKKLPLKKVIEQATIKKTPVFFQKTPQAPSEEPSIFLKDKEASAIIKEELALETRETPAKPATPKVKEEVPRKTSMRSDARLKYQRLIYYKDDMVLTEQALQAFVKDSGAKKALLIDKEGHLIAAQGEMHSYDLEAVSILIMDSFSDTQVWAKLLQEEFSHIFHKGKKNSVMVSIVTNKILLAVVFDNQTISDTIKQVSDIVVEKLEEIFKDVEKKDSQEPMYIEEGFGDSSKALLDDLFSDEEEKVPQEPILGESAQTLLDNLFSDEDGGSLKIESKPDELIFEQSRDEDLLETGELLFDSVDQKILPQDRAEAEHFIEAEMKIAGEFADVDEVKEAIDFMDAREEIVTPPDARSRVSKSDFVKDIGKSIEDRDWEPLSRDLKEEKITLAKQWQEVFAAMEKAEEKAREIPSFEQALSSEAGKPGPIERFMAQFTLILKGIQATIGLKFILVASALDVLLTTVTGYIQGIFRAFRTSKGIARRLQRRDPQKQLNSLALDQSFSRLQLSRLLAFSGFYCEEHIAKPPQTTEHIQTFALKLVLEIRDRLDEMKLDLNLLTPAQVAQMAKKSTMDLLLSFLPNPLELFVPWKDFFVLNFVMKYSRKQIEQMYADLLALYLQLAKFLLQEENADVVPDNLWQLSEYEEKLLERVGKKQLPQDLNQCIAQTKLSLQRLLQILCNAEQFIQPRLFSRFDLVKEVFHQEQMGYPNPRYTLELECWLRKQVALILKNKKIVADSNEKQQRWQEARDLQKRYSLQKRLSKAFFI